MRNDLLIFDAAILKPYSYLSLGQTGGESYTSPLVLGNKLANGILSFKFLELRLCVGHPFLSSTSVKSPDIWLLRYCFLYRRADKQESLGGKRVKKSTTLFHFHMIWLCTVSVRKYGDLRISNLYIGYLVVLSLSSLSKRVRSIGLSTTPDLFFQMTNYWISSPTGQHDASHKCPFRQRKASC